MNEQDQKLLTEKMGECWHEPDSECAVGREYNGGGTIKQKCLKCGCLLSTTYQIYEDNRTFDTPDDFFVVWTWAKGQEWWEEFLAENSTYDDTLHGIIDVEAIDPIRFPALVVQFGKEALGWEAEQ